MVALDKVVVGGFADKCGTAHGLLDNLAHLQEAALVVEESAVHDLVGCIEARHVYQGLYQYPLVSWSGIVPDVADAHCL